MITISSLTIVSAGWFDFLGGEDDSINNPIVPPNNFKQFKLNNSDSSNSHIFYQNQHKYYGANYYEDDEKSTVTYTSEGEEKYLVFNLYAEIDLHEIPDESVRNDIIEFYKSNSDGQTRIDVYSMEDIESISDFFTHPSNETGGMYVKVFDKDNNVLLTQNIVTTPYERDSDYSSETILDFNVNEYNRASGFDKFRIISDIQLNIENNDKMSGIVEKIDHAELHMLFANGTDSDICIPLKPIDKTDPSK